MIVHPEPPQGWAWRFGRFGTGWSCYGSRLHETERLLLAEDQETLELARDVATNAIADMEAKIR